MDDPRAPFLDLSGPTSGNSRFSSQCDLGCGWENPGEPVGGTGDTCMVYIYIPGSSRYVNFLPFCRFFGGKGTNFTHKRKIQVYDCMFTYTFDILVVPF